MGVKLWAAVKASFEPLAGAAFIDCYKQTVYGHIAANGGSYRTAWSPSVVSAASQIY